MSSASFVANDCRRLSQRERGAYFTPDYLCDFLVEWAIREKRAPRILDPTCGDGAFLGAALRRLQAVGPCDTDTRPLVVGVDIDSPSIEGAARALLGAGAAEFRLHAMNVFDISSPADLGSEPFDAIVGNPPFVRYQLFGGAARAKALARCLEQGVRLSGLASSWASVLVHAASLLHEEGRLAMVLPAEVLTVNYAEPIRTWLRTRFRSVRLLALDGLHFTNATERVVLLLAEGRGECTSFNLSYVPEAADLKHFRNEAGSVSGGSDGRWSSFLLSSGQRETYSDVLARHFVALSHYGRPELGGVTGANAFFALSEMTRERFGIETDDVVAICPPGTRHLRGSRFTAADWTRLRDIGARVWLLNARTETPLTSGMQKYVRLGELMGIASGYKCRVRKTWWRPPVAPTPDLFFTYMSHNYPRLIRNSAGVTFLNSMHGVRLHREDRAIAKNALPLLMLNSISMLGAEIGGRSYGGGILKMEPREASALPVPRREDLERAWSVLRDDRERLEKGLRRGEWSGVVARIDDVLLRQVMHLPPASCEMMQGAVATLRGRRLGVRGVEAT